MPLFNAENLDDVQRLKSALNTSKEEMRPLLDERKECLVAYQGHRFSGATSRLTSTRGGDPRMSIPLMEIAIDLHEQLLAGESVRAIAAPQRSGLIPLGETIKSTLDLLIEAIDLGQTFQTWVKESLWGTGVAKVAMSFERGKVRGRGGGFSRATSIPFVDVIDSEDLLIDTQASVWERKRFIGNEYLVPLEWAKDSPSFRKGPRSELQAVDPLHDRPHASASPIPRKFGQHDFIPMTVLRDVYLPLDQRIITLAKTGPREVLRNDPWKGPSIGPYHLMGYEFVPDTIIPKPLAWSWIDAHDSANVLYNKAVRQALRSKRNPLVPTGAEKDGDKIRNAVDGDWLGVTKADLIQTFVIPGADPSLLNLVGQLIDVFSYMAGNVNLLAGLSAQSATLGQDKLLAGGGSRRMSELQRRAKRAFSRVLQSLAWYLFRETSLNVRMEQKVGDITIPVTLRHDDLKGRFLDFNFAIEPIRHKSPDERLGLLLTWIRQVVLPLQGQMAQAGLGLDMEELHKIGRDYGDIPELDRIIKNLGGRPSLEETAVLTGRRGATGAGQTGAGGGNGAAPAGNGRLLSAVTGPQEAGFV